MSDLAHLASTFLWLSMIAVGGGLGVVPEMERQVVHHYHWLTAREFVDGYTLSQVTPGPNMLVAVFVGYRAHGVSGAIVAGSAMFLPAAAIMALVARHWQWLQMRPWARAAERALAPVGLGLMAAGVYTLARSAVSDVTTAALALGAALLLARRSVPPAIVVIAAGLVGWLL